MIGEPHPQSMVACIARVRQTADDYHAAHRVAMLAIQDLKARRRALEEASVELNAHVRAMEEASNQARTELNAISERRSQHEAINGTET